MQGVHAVGNASSIESLVLHNIPLAPCLSRCLYDLDRKDMTLGPQSFLTSAGADSSSVPTVVVNNLHRKTHCRFYVNENGFSLVT